MPEISRFFGIIIRMFSEVNVPHHHAHFHVYYQNSSAVYTINPIEMIEGELPRRQQRLVEAWAELHTDELITDWQRLQNGTRPLPIEPLR